MNTTKPAPKVKPTRSAQLSRMSHGKLLLGIYENGEPKYFYILEPLSSDFGVAYRLGKSTPDGCSDSYDVLLCGRESSCTCPGHTYTGHCKHLDAIQALTTAGKLPMDGNGGHGDSTISNTGNAGQATSTISNGNPMAAIQEMRLGESIDCNGHRVERIATGWRINGRYAGNERLAANLCAKAF